MTVDVERVLAVFRTAVDRHARVGDVLRAEDALRPLLSTSALASWAALDRAARRIDVDIDQLRFGPQLGHLAGLIATMTRSGYARLHLVERLAGHDALTLAALLWRLDDVVFAVRTTARARVEFAVAHAPVDVLARVLPVVQALRARDRARGEEVLTQVEQRLIDAGVVARGDQPQDVQRALLRLWGLSAHIDNARRAAIALDALRDGDVELALDLTRRISARSADIADDAGLDGVVDAFAAHSAARVRQQAVRLARHRPSVLLALSVDVRAEVRADARRALGGIDTDCEQQRDAARCCVDEADDVGASRVVIGALASLAEVGRPDDFARISRFLHDERARVQAEAVRALVGSHASGGLDAFVDVLLDKLLAPSWRVGVEAARAFSWFPAEKMPIDSLRRAEEQAHPAVRKLLAHVVGPGHWSC